MSKAAQYVITAGLSGCYMPDSNSGPMEFSTRREMASYIRQELEYQEFPARLFRDVNLRDLWRMIQRHGSSSMHFSLCHKGREIAFHGMTNAEFDAALAEQD